MEYLLEVDADLSLGFYQKKPGGMIRTTLEEILGDKKPGRYTMEIKLIRQIRTVQQNRLYFAYLGMIAVEVGYIHPDMDNQSKSEIIDALHEHFKDRFLGGKTIKSQKDKRRRLKVKGSSKVLDTKEFTDYIEKIHILHPYLPDPENLDEKNLFVFVDQYYFK